MWLLLCWRGAQILLFGLTLLDYLPEVWQRIRLKAYKNHEEFQRRRTNNNYGNVHRPAIVGLRPGVLAEDIHVQRAAEIEDAEPNPSHVAAIKGKLNSLNTSQLRSRQRGKLISLPASTEDAHEHLENNKEPGRVSTVIGSHRRRAVAEIAKKFEENDFNSKVHKASLVPPVAGTYFEGLKVPKETNGSNAILISNEFASNFPRPPPSNYRSEDVSVPLMEKRHPTPNCNTSQANDLPALTRSGDNTSHNGESSELLPGEESLCIIRRHTQLPGRISHAPVESIEEILAQQRFSRSFSTYSISDLLKDSGIDVNADVDMAMEECFNGTGK